MTLTARSTTARVARALLPHVTLHVALAALLLPSSAIPARAARPFPETRTRTRVFADQLPSRLSDAQWAFAAGHYAGSQKQTVSWTRRMRGLQPGYLMLHYQLAVGAGPAAFVEGDRWTNDFDAVSRHADWFVRDAEGHRILQTAWNWYVMDVRFQGDRPRTGFPAYWVQTAIHRMRMNEADGCFADSYTQDILMGQVRPPNPMFSDVAVCKRDWLPGLNRYGAYCAAAFHRAPETFYFLPNFGGQVTTWDNVTDLLVGDGGMIEGFAAPGPGQYFSDADWKLQMSRVLSLARNGKIVIAQTSIDPAGTDHRWFVTGSYLLTRGPRSYLNMLHEGSLEWYPEYAVDLGAYREEPADLSALWRADWGVYRRDFARGFVLVNPSEQSVKVPDFGGAYRLVAASGGGAVPEDGKEPGALTTSEVRSVTIPAHSARVLLNGTSSMVFRGVPARGGGEG